MVLLFLTVCLTGTVLNLTLLYAIMKEKLYRSTNNLYIMNLAVSDLAIAIGIIFFPTLNYALISWPFGALGCKIFEVIRDSVTPVSLLTLTALSHDRYSAVFSTGVRRPDQKGSIKLSSCIASRSGIIIISMWVASFCTLIPITVYGTLPELPLEKVGDHRICMLDRYEYLEPKILVVIRCTITYVIPLIMIAYNYSAIAWKLFSISNKLEKYRETPAMDRSRRKALSRAKLILLLVLVFVFCSFPCHFFLWIFYFAKDDVHRTTYFWDNWRVIGFYLFYLYPILNPMFLYATSEQYKSLYDKYLFCCRRTDVVVDDDDDDDEREESVGKGHASTKQSAGTEEYEMSHSGTSNVRSQVVA